MNAPQLNSHTKSILDFVSRLKKQLSLLSNDCETDASPAAKATWGVAEWKVFGSLAQNISLSETESFALACAAAFAIDSELGVLASIAQNDLSKQYLTINLLNQLLDGECFQMLDPENPLRKHGLLRIGNESFVPQVTQPIEIEPRVLNHLLGINAIDERLQHFCSRLCVDGSEFVQPGVEEQFAATLKTSVNGVVGIVGNHVSALHAIQTWCSQSARTLYEVDARHLPERVDELDILATLIRREHLLGTASFVAICASAQLDRARRLLQSADVSMFLADGDAATVDCLSENYLVLPKPDRKQQLSNWNQFVDQQKAQDLVEQFDFELYQVHLIGNKHLHSGSDVVELCRSKNRPEFGRLACQIDCIATWDDIVIPDATRKKLRAVCDQVKHRYKVLEDWGFARKLNRGIGTAVLFHGESGTGKTMAAEVIANDLNRELYRIDLSTVVDKYIGETEKNLSAIFDAAEKSKCVLFFDEADALFGKRSEVSDARDRYANIEINYLLQRLESFDGLTILATNVRRHMDQAFVRRFKYVIEFPFPDAATRKEIWKHSIPDDTPIGDVDFDHLAQISVTGGTIANTVINAAFASAAVTNECVGMASLLQALRFELEKLDQPINELDFRRAPQMEVVA